MPCVREKPVMFLGTFSVPLRLIIFFDLCLLNSTFFERPLQLQCLAY